MPIMLAQLEIASPGRLLVLVLLPALVYLALRGRRDLSWWQRATATSLRCLIFGLLCLAWATPSCRVASDRQFIVVAVDESISAASDAAKAAETILAHRNNKRQDVVVRQIAFGSDSAQTNIAGAIHHAQSLCPPDRVGKVVVVTDGLETDGSLLQAAAGSDVPISVLPVDAFSAPEIAVEQIITPGSVVPHELVDVEVIVTANHDDSVTLSLLSEGVLLATEPLNVAKGITTWRREVEPPQAGAMVLQAIVAGGRDTLEENNAMQAVFVRSAPTKVMIVGEPEKIESLKDAITSSGFDVDVRQPSEAPRSANELAPTSLLVLAEVTASDLQTQQLIALNRYVREGGGLITIGGDTTFGAAAYELTALEKMLPVVATEQPVQQQKSLALVLVVDKSKSMEEENRLGLAKEAAKKVAEVLQDRDQVGVLAFGNQSEWISRLAPLDNKDEVLARIDKLTAEGLTNMYPAVQRAYLALSQADADSRHCILLTDGVPTPGDFDDVARRMAEAGITVSTVSLGQGADQTILKDISRIARGNHYHVDNPDDLPRILERETRTAAEKVTSDEFPVTALRRLPGLTVDDAPRLSNYVATNHKPKAQVLLTAGEGDPLLAWWRFGRGKAMVLTTDYSKSATAWQNWSGRNAFWKRLVTYAMRDVQFGDTLHIAQHNGEVTITLDAIQSSEDGSFYVTDGKAKLQMQPIDEQSGSVSELSMPHVAPGRYQATFAGLPGEQFLLTATLDGTIHGQRGVVIDYPLEYRLHHSDEAKLQAAAAVSGGQYAPTAEEIFAPDGRTVDVVHPLWPYVVIAAILLYLLETAIRRLPMHQPAGDVQARRRAA